MDIDPNFFVFNRNRDKRIAKIIEKENLQIGTMLYETYLGADIVFARDDKGVWNFTLYRRMRGTSLEIMMIISAFTSIKRRISPWFNPTKKPFDIEIKNYLLELNIKSAKNIEIAEDMLYSIREGIIYAFETRYTLENNISLKRKSGNLPAIISRCLSQFSWHFNFWVHSPH